MKYILTFLILVLSSITHADDRELIETVDKLRQETQPDNNTYQKQIEDVYETIKSMKPAEIKLPNYTLFGESQINIMKNFGLPTPDKFMNEEDDDGSCTDPARLGDYRIFIFISESVPMHTLQNYMRDVIKLPNVIFILRGVVGSADFIKPTQNFITNIACGKNMEDLKTDENCSIGRVDINPLLFTIFGVDQVPAVVFSKLSYQELMIRANTGKSVDKEEYFILRGDTVLSHVLERFEEAGAETAQYIEILHGSYGE